MPLCLQPPRNCRGGAVALVAAAAALTAAGFAVSAWSLWHRRRWKHRLQSCAAGCGVAKSTFADLVGNTPLVRINSLSDALGVEVLGKAEFMNPGGSVKDRVAVSILRDAAKSLPATGGLVVEGTSGSTGISLALGANSFGHTAMVFLPSDQALEKKNMLRAIGARVVETPTVSASNPQHYINQSAQADGYFADQFENHANFRAHYDGTGKEILQQTKGRIHGFVASCGTGGTLSGCAARLKDANPAIRVVAADPVGSGVVSAVECGLMFNDRDREGHRKQIYTDTIVEGVGLNRLTWNFSQGLPLIDKAYTVCDLEAVHMARWLVKHDGLFCGSSSALNCCAVVKACKQGIFKPGQTVVVILCDSGVRHLSRFYNETVLQDADLLPQYIAPGNPCTYSKSTNGVCRSVIAAQSSVPPTDILDFID